MRFPRVVRFVDMGSKLVAAEGLGEEGMGVSVSRGQSFSLGEMKKSRDGWRGGSRNSEIILGAQLHP